MGIEETMQLQDFANRVKKEYSVFHELYGKPIEEGVNDILVPGEVMQLVCDRYNTLMEIAHESIDKMTIALTALLPLRELIYDKKILEKKPFIFSHDLNDHKTNKDGLPYFTWNLRDIMYGNLQDFEDIENDWWQERELSINDTSERKNSLAGHYLVYHQDKLIDGTDSNLVIGVGRNKDYIGFAFCMNQGNLAASVVNGKDPVDTRNALDELYARTNITPQHLLYYIQNSNLSSNHQKDLEGVVSLLSGYPRKEPGELFSE